VSIRYVTDENGKRVEVIMPVEEYDRLLETLEDHEDARAADETRAAIERGEDELIPFDEALEEMKRNRAKRGL
jgi:PHD/YefM family antitoxin component YafN of YafNO toxin-antitoxin module